MRFGVLTEVTEQQFRIEGIVDGSRLQFDDGRAKNEHVVNAGQFFLVEVRVRFLAVVVVN